MAGFRGADAAAGPGVLRALLKRAPAASRSCPLVGGRFGILQSAAALLTPTTSAVATPQDLRIRDDLLLATLAVAACAGKKDRLVLWDVLLAPDLFNGFPSLLPGFRPKAPGVGLRAVGGDLDWLVIALFPVEKEALSISVDSTPPTLVFRSLGAADARDIFLNRLKKALYQGWTNRSNEKPTRPTAAIHGNGMGLSKRSTSVAVDERGSWGDLPSLLNDVGSLGIAVGDDVRLQFADAVVDADLVGYVEAALIKFKGDALVHLRSIEAAERERAAGGGVGGAEAIGPLPDQAPNPLPIAASGASRFRKKVPAAPISEPAVPTPSVGGSSRFKKKSAPLVAGVAPTNSVTVLPADRPVHQPATETPKDKKLTWAEKVREGSQSPYRKVQGGFNIAYFLSMVRDFKTLAGPHPWQALLPLAAQDGHMKSPVLLPPNTTRSATGLPPQFERVVSLLVDTSPSGFQNAVRYAEAAQGDATQKHIDHIYTHRQLRRLIKHIHDMRDHMPNTKMVPVYIDAEFGHTRFNKSISLLQLCYYVKGDGTVAGRLRQRVAIIDVHQLLNTEKRTRRAYTQSHNPQSATVSKDQQRPTWVPRVRWAKTRRASYLLQRGIFGNPFVLKVLHGSTTDLILLFRSLGCHLLMPLPAEASHSVATHVWTPSPFLDTGSIDMKMRFIIWDTLTAMANAGSPTKVDLPMPVSVHSNVGLATLMKRFNTGHLKSLFLTIQNWDRRPLQEELLQYAADDVRYLHEIFFGLLRGVAVAASFVEGDRKSFEALASPLLQRILNDMTHLLSAPDSFDSEVQIASTSTSTTGFRRSATVTYSGPEKVLVADEDTPLDEIRRDEADLEAVPTAASVSRDQRPSFRPYIFGPEATLMLTDALQRWLEEQRRTAVGGGATASSTPTVFILSEKTTADPYPNSDGVLHIPVSAFLRILLNADNALLFAAMPDLRPSPEAIQSGKRPTEVHFSHSDASPQGRTLRAKHANMRKIIDRIQGAVVRGISRKLANIALQNPIDDLINAHKGGVSEMVSSLLRECGTITDPTLLAHGFRSAPNAVVTTVDAAPYHVPAYELECGGSSLVVARHLPSLLLDPITRPPSLLSSLFRWAGHVHRVSKFNIANQQQESFPSGGVAVVPASSGSSFFTDKNLKKQSPGVSTLTPSLASWGSAFQANDAASNPSSAMPYAGENSSTASGGGGGPSEGVPSMGAVRKQLDSLIDAWKSEAQRLKLRSGRGASRLQAADVVSIYRDQVLTSANEERSRRLQAKGTIARTDDAALEALSTMKAALRVHKNALVGTTYSILAKHPATTASRDVLQTIHRDGTVKPSSVMDNHLSRVYFNLVLTVAIHSVMQCYSLLLQVPALPSTSLSLMNFSNEVYDPQADSYLSKHESFKLKKKRFTMSKVKGKEAAADSEKGSVEEEGSDADIGVEVFAASPPFPAPVLSHQFEMVVIEAMKRVEENEQILEIRKKRTSADGQKQAASSPASVLEKKFNNGDAKDVLRCFLGSAHNFQPTRKLAEGEIATAAKNRKGVPPRWATTIVPLPSNPHEAYNVALVTSKVFHGTFAALLTAAVQRSYYATEYLLFLLSQFHIHVSDVAKGTAEEVLAEGADEDPAGLVDLLSGIRDTIAPMEAVPLGSKHLSATLSFLNQFHPHQYASNEATCGAARRAILSSLSAGQGDHWTHEAVVGVLIEDYTLAVEEESAQIGLDSSHMPALLAFSRRLLVEVLIPLSNSYVSPQIIEGLTSSKPNAAAVVAEASNSSTTQPLSSLTTGALFPRFYHPLRLRTPAELGGNSTGNKDTSMNASATAGENPADDDVVERAAQANAKNTHLNTADDIVVAERKNYGVPLPCLMTREEFAYVATTLFSLNNNVAEKDSPRLSSTAVSAVLRSAHLAPAASRVLASPSPWVSAHEYHLVRLIQSLMSTITPTQH